MVRKGGSRISFTPHSTTARSKNGGMTPFVERPSPPRALKSTQEPPFPAHRRAGGGSRCVGGLLEVGENGNSWGSAGGGDLFDLLPAHGGHDFIVGAGRENRDPAPRPRRTPRPSDAPTAPPASTDPGEGRGDQASRSSPLVWCSFGQVVMGGRAGRSGVPGARSKRQTDPGEGAAARGGAHLPKRVVFTASASS